MAETTKPTVTPFDYEVSLRGAYSRNEWKEVGTVFCYSLDEAGAEVRSKYGRRTGMDVVSVSVRPRWKEGENPAYRQGTKEGAGSSAAPAAGVVKDAPPTTAQRIAALTGLIRIKEVPAVSVKPMQPCTYKAPN